MKPGDDLCCFEAAREKNKIFMKIRLSVVAVFSVVVAWSAVCAAAEPSISNLPAAVQERIRERKGQGEVKKINTRRQADGRNVYEIEYKEGGDEKMVV